MDWRYAVAGEQRARSDARKLQELRCLQCAGAQHNLPFRASAANLAALLIDDANRFSAFELNPGGQRLGEDVEVWPPPIGLDIGLARR